MKKFNGIKLIILVVFLLTTLLMGCKTQLTTEEQSEINFSYSMSALTVAIERSYKKAIEEKSTAVLSADYLNEIPKQDDLADDISNLKKTNFLRAIKITQLSVFNMQGNSTSDIINNYCGNEGYRVIVANYILETLTIRIVNNDSDKKVEIYNVVSDEYSLMLIEGLDGGLCTIHGNGNKYEYDENRHITKMESEFVFGTYSEGLNEKVGNIDIEYKVFCTVNNVDNSVSFISKRDNIEKGYEHDYVVNKSSLKQYDLNDYYTVSELVLPLWYIR